MDAAKRALGDKKTLVVWLLEGEMTPAWHAGKQANGVPNATLDACMDSFQFKDGASPVSRIPQKTLTPLRFRRLCPLDRVARTHGGVRRCGLRSSRRARRRGARSSNNRSFVRRPFLCAGLRRRRFPRRQGERGGRHETQNASGGRQGARPRSQDAPTFDEIVHRQHARLSRFGFPRQRPR